jgi:hypothetical protein
MIGDVCHYGYKGVRRFVGFFEIDLAEGFVDEDVPQYCLLKDVDLISLRDGMIPTNPPTNLLIVNIFRLFDTWISNTPVDASRVFIRSAKLVLVFVLSHASVSDKDQSHDLHDTHQSESIFRRMEENLVNDK